MPTFQEDAQVIRQEQEAYIRDEVLNEEERAAFTGLKFYPPDERYVFRLPLKLYPETQVVTRPTTKGETRQFLEVGTVNIPFPEKSVELIVFAGMKDAELEHLFIPFNDSTGGQETYAGGRSVNLKRQGDEVIADFNIANNPYCAYGDRWNCAMTPKDNRLSIPVPVGELRYRDVDH